MRKALAMLLASIVAAGSLAACGSNTDADDTIGPPARGPVIAKGAPLPGGGTASEDILTCAYIIDAEQECGDSGINPQHWYQTPNDKQPGLNEASDDDDRLYGYYGPFYPIMWGWPVTYPQYYYGSGYQSRYLSKLDQAKYDARAKAFNAKNGTYFPEYAKKADWRDANNKKVDATKIDPKRFAPVKNNGGSRGTTKICGMIKLQNAITYFTNSFGILAKGGGGGGRSGGSSGSKAGGGSSTSKSGSTSKSNSGGDRGKGGTSKGAC